MIRFWGQPKFGVGTGKLVGYELFLRTRPDRDGTWSLPPDFSQISINTLSKLVMDTIDSSPSDLQLFSLNLDQKQFVDPQYWQQLAGVQRQTPVKLIIELTERVGNGPATVTNDLLVAAASAYSRDGLPVCLDDVGTGANQPDLVTVLDPFVTEYKYALQNVRGVLGRDEIRQQIAYWSTRAARGHRELALEGLESSADLPLITQYAPDIVQGYYFGRPHPMTIAADLRP